MRIAFGCLMPVFWALSSAITQGQVIPATPTDTKGQIEQKIQRADARGDLNAEMNLERALDVEKGREGEKADAMRLPNAAYWARLHEIYFADFQKDVRAFSRITQAIVPSDPAIVRAQAKQLDKNTSSLLNYFLQGEKAPEVNYAGPDNVESLMTLIKPVKQGLLDYEGKRLVLDAPNYVTLLKNLERLERISHNLSR